MLLYRNIPYDHISWLYFLVRQAQSYEQILLVHLSQFLQYLNQQLQLVYKSASRPQ
nr:MAG TPA: hypothetical protein [Caudoviricetes sp.]